MVEGSADITYSCVQGGWAGEGNIDADPLFIAEGRWDDNGTPNDPDDDFWLDGVYELMPGSPCIDAGNNEEVPEEITTDYAGNPRFVDDPDTVDTGFGPPPIVDMGAYEFQVGDPCPADVNDDEVADIDDLFDILGHWGEGAGPYDVNGDGAVDIDDIFDVLAAWGPCP
ncbi:MAG: hypothetical protein JSV91_08835 [Phycisphaerales bacterium]|nr:MAG: hypothetical protein JSV91_08835 [Phycisphaerales bacterium]